MLTSSAKLLLLAGSPEEEEEAWTGYEEDRGGAAFLLPALAEEGANREVIKMRDTQTSRKKCLCTV
jgi:hypothetical protein